MLCLFDTNGGTLPSRVTGVVAEVCERFDGAIGIHAHNDSEVAVANSLTAVEAGATLVDGCRTATESAAGTQVLLQGTTQNRSALVGPRHRGRLVRKETHASTLLERRK